MGSDVLSKIEGRWVGGLFKDCILLPTFQTVWLNNLCRKWVNWEYNYHYSHFINEFEDVIRDNSSFTVAKMKYALYASISALPQINHLVFSLTLKEIQIQFSMFPGSSNAYKVVKELICLQFYLFLCICYQSLFNVYRDNLHIPLDHIALE